MTARRRVRRHVVLAVFANDRHGAGRGYLRNLPRERRDIEEALAPAVERGHCELVVESNVTHERLFDLFDHHGFSIIGVHFGGHAEPGGLQLEDSSGRPVSALMEGIAHRLAELPDLRWIFLNGCGTAAHLAVLHGQLRVPIIATENAILDDVAARFARRFYFRLARHGTLTEAFDAARSEVRSSRAGAAEVVREGRAGEAWFEALDEVAPAATRMGRRAGGRNDAGERWPWILVVPAGQRWMGHQRLGPIAATNSMERPGSVPVDPERALWVERDRGPPPAPAPRPGTARLGTFGLRAASPPPPSAERRTQRLSRDQADAALVTDVVPAARHPTTRQQPPASPPRPGRPPAGWIAVFAVLLLAAGAAVAALLTR